MRRVARSIALALALSLFGVAPAQAQPAEAEKPKPKQYVVQYTLLVLLVSLGVTVVCRPSNRLDEPPFQKE